MLGAQRQRACQRMTTELGKTGVSGNLDKSGTVEWWEWWPNWRACVKGVGDGGISLPSSLSPSTMSGHIDVLFCSCVSLGK